MNNDNDIIVVDLSSMGKRKKVCIDIETLKTAIPTGEANAIHMDELAERIGVKKESVKAIVQRARRSTDFGKWIVSSVRGYWIAETDEELQRYHNTLRKQAISRFITIKPVRRTLNEIKGQISLIDTLKNESDNTGRDTTDILSNDRDENVNIVSDNGGGGIGKEEEI